MVSLKNILLLPCYTLAGDNSVDAKFGMDVAITVGPERFSEPSSEAPATPSVKMANTDQTHPLGDEETDQINPAVADGLTPAQLEWLGNQSTVVGRKKLQILRQALFEWVGEHLEYRFDEARFGDTVRRALQEFMNRHHEDLPAAKADRRLERS